MISESLIDDEEFNSLSIEAQNVFFRILSVADDYGVVPGNEYTLTKKINPPEKICKHLMVYLKEIVDKKLGHYFMYDEKQFFMFKRKSFDEINSYVINKRTKSEYLKKDKDFMESENLLESLGISSQDGLPSIESRKIKVKVESERDEKFEKFWDAYDKKVGCKDKLKKKWFKLTDEEMEKIFIYIPLYKMTQPDKQYRKNPETFLNNKSWNDEIIISKRLENKEEEPKKVADYTNPIMGEMLGRK